jgi:uncharacterized membrane protein YkvA (DUF1232 family)
LIAGRTKVPNVVATLISIVCFAAATGGYWPRLGPLAGTAGHPFHHLLAHPVNPTFAHRLVGRAAWPSRVLGGSTGETSARVPVVVGTWPGVQPFEEQLSAGTTNLFKGVRYGVRRSARFLRWSAKRWAGWVMRAFGFLLVLLLVPLVDRELVSSWKENGWRGVRTSILLGLAVHVRLLVDRQAPLVGKMAVAFAIGYGVASRDLMPDGNFPLGLMDDLLVIALAARGFVLMCPSWMVTEHALHAARARERRQV